MEERDDRQVSLITVTFNSGRDLVDFWSGYTKSMGEWIVVDNASTDDSREIAANLGARVVPLSRNVGFGAANNVGAAVATGDVFIFANPDVTVDARGIRNLAAAAATGDVVSPQLINVDGSLQENARGAPYPWRKVAHYIAPNGRVNERYSLVAERGPRTPVWTMGAAMAVSASTFSALKGWDPKYFVYYEDSDFCLRARKSGRSVVLDDSVSWRHGWARETKGNTSWRAWKHEFISGVRFYSQHPECILPLGGAGRRLRSWDRQARG